MSETTLRVGWAAGRFDSDPAEVAAYLADNVRRYHLDLVGTDESQQRHIAAIVAEALPEYGVAKRGEYMAVYRRTVLKRRGRSRMWHLSAVAGLIGWRQMRAGVFPLTLTTLGIPVRLMCSHAPSAVEAAGRWSGVRKQVAASKRGHHRWGIRIRRAHRRRPRLLQIALEDSNLNQRHDTWRHWLTSELGAPSVWAGRVPSRGSHGDRLIDTGHVFGAHVEVLEAHVSDVRRPPGYDHDLIWFTIRITRSAP